MKISPPRLAIDPTNPFKDALFDRKDFGESLTQLLRNVSESLVIFVNAPWGEGKTTFAEMWRASLRQQKLEVIYFDAYAADYFDDPFVSFSGEILAMVDERLNERGKAERREFKETAVAVGKRLAGLAVKVGLRAATLGAVESAHLSELKDIGSEIATGVSEIGADIVEKKIENYSSEKDALAAFKKSLKKLAAVVRDEQDFPLTVIVDELDRCRPDFALGLLERIKHLFDVEGVAFMLLVNREQIESYIRAIYGTGVDAASYLLKFGDLFVDLPNHQPIFHSEKGRMEYCRDLFRHYGFSGRNGDTLGRSINTLVTHFDMTLREIERVFTIMSLYYGSLPEGHLTHDFLIPLLSVLKVKRPSFYRELSRGTVSSNRFLQEVGIDQFSNVNHLGVNPDWVKQTLMYCLLSDDELEQIVATEKNDHDGRSPLAEMGRWLVRYDMDRGKVIPFFCNRLDRFSVKP